MYPSPFGWCSLEISTEQPLLELSLYKDTLARRHKVNSLFWLKLPVLREGQPAAHGHGEGPVSSCDNPSKPVLCSGVFCRSRNGGGQLFVLPPLPSPIIPAKKQTSKSLAKAFQLWPTATVHWDWQIPCYVLDEVATTFSLDSDNFLSYFPTLFTNLPSKRLVSSFSLCLFAKSLLHTRRPDSVCCVPSLLLVCFQELRLHPCIQILLVSVHHLCFHCQFPLVVSLLSYCVILIPLATNFFDSSLLTLSFSI